MKIIRSIEKMQSLSLQLRIQNKTVGLVPTMGYLHSGHTSLMRIADMYADKTVVSIFVNPTQFGPGEDLKTYPRDFERDADICEKENVDILFYPRTDEIYAPDYSVYVHEEVLSPMLCGKSRPDHFRGVCTIVAKLFNIVQPTFSVFGQKDFQQLRILQRMTRDLNFPVEIVSAPIVREIDGLAISSRNKYLNEEERKQALCLREALNTAEQLYMRAEKDANIVKKAMGQVIAQYPLAKVDYIEIMNTDTLQPVKHIKSSCLVALAVFVGKTRLIDNTIL